MTRSPAGGRTASSLSVSAPPCVYASARVFMRFARQCGARVWAALRPLALARDTEPTAKGEAPCTALALSPSLSRYAAKRRTFRAVSRFNRAPTVLRANHRREQRRFPFSGYESASRTETTIETLQTLQTRRSSREGSVKEKSEKRTRFRPLEKGQKKREREREREREPLSRGIPCIECKTMQRRVEGNRRGLLGGAVVGLHGSGGRRGQHRVGGLGPRGPVPRCRQVGASASVLLPLLLVAPLSPLRDRGGYTGE